MRKSGSLLGFYPSAEAAEEALKQLRKHHFRRSALIQRSSAGVISFDEVSSFYALIAGLFIGIFMPVLVYGFSAFLGFSLNQSLFFTSITLVFSFILGVVFHRAFIRFLGIAVEQELLGRYSRCLIAEEAVVIVQASPRSIGRAVALLRRISRDQPTIFASHPARKIHLKADENDQDEPLSTAHIEEHARELAEAHSIKPAEGRGEPLLDHLAICEKIILEVRQTLAEASRFEQSISTSAEWILDNYFIVHGHITDVRENLSKRFYHELPVLTEGPYRGDPRVYGIAAELVIHTDGQLDRHNIRDFLDAYQSVSSLSTGELWALPIMLRIALVDRLRSLFEKVDSWLRESESADFWSNRLAVAVRNDPDQIFNILSRLTEEFPDPSANFALQIIDHIYDEESILNPVRGWLERKVGSPLESIISEERALQTSDEIAIGNGMTSLRWLKQFDWREVFEEQSSVEAILRDDPMGIYSSMDFYTRDSYRKAAEEISRCGKHDEREVAQLAIKMAMEGSGVSTDPSASHVGRYLIGDGKEELLDRLECRDNRRNRVLQWVYRRHTSLYLTTIGAVSLAVTGTILGLGLSFGSNPAYLAILVLLSLVPASQFGVQVVNYLVTRLLPPRKLPKMFFQKRGIPDEFRTLVVVPVLLTDRAGAMSDLESLEIRYKANPDHNLVFGLFTDFVDHVEPHREDDEELFSVAEKGLERLNNRYGSNRFYLFHREREWAESEDRYMGWERKRGKLEDLNRLICGESPRNGRQIVRVGDPDRLSDIRYVITLDSDTQLPHGTGARLIETMAHPLNRPVIDPVKMVVRSGYAVIQPRVSTSLPSATGTLFSRLFTNPVGTDPYTTAVSDVYQDLTGEGSYLGKGIYDPKVLQQVLRNRFPDGRLLSHDLVEGAYARVGLATDIELFDEFPADYHSYCFRTHRWIRGDWQIAQWCLSKVPVKDGRREKNPLSAMARWKFFDNLRRSLLPVASVPFLAAAWLMSPAAGFLCSGFVGLLYMSAFMANLSTWLTSNRDVRKNILRSFRHDLNRSLAEIAIMVHQAGLAADAILRVLYRRFVSHKGLLRWTTAQMAKTKAKKHMHEFFSQVMGNAFLAFLMIAAIWLRDPLSLVPAAPFLALWLVSPIIIWRMDLTVMGKQRMFSRREALVLRKIARKTWRIFDDFVGTGTHWLPPDNYQISHVDEIAPRTSPTNIGLYLLTVLAAGDFGFITLDEVSQRLRNTHSTLKQLKRYEGHLFNWYDVATLRPLMPGYVSTVDSGNFIGSLWTLEHGLKELMDEPIIGPRTFRGIHDTVLILGDALRDAGLTSKFGKTITELMELTGDPHDELEGMIRGIREIAAPSGKMVLGLRAEVDRYPQMHYRKLDDEELNPVEDAAYWAARVDSQIAEWNQIIDRYLKWAEMLFENHPGEIEALAGGERRDWKLLHQAPSLRQLAAENASFVQSVIDGQPENGSPSSRNPAGLTESMAPAVWAAWETLEDVEDLIRMGRELADGINLKFLYHERRKIFHVGFNINDQRLDNAFYDLLASEARLTSYVAVARGDVPIEHWMALSRPFGAMGRRRVLLSWSGTMFEYLMPLLFQKNYENSLLDMACREAVDTQIKYGKQRGVPWGISESAYADLDASKIYQYQAFGVPGLGLKRGLDEDLVVAPYATMLALSLVPAEAIGNLNRLAGMGLYGRFGFFESIDFSRRKKRQGDKGVIVRTYMAHHQAMGFLAIDNALHNQVMQRRFHSDVRVKALEPLLYERIPPNPSLFHVRAREQASSSVMPTEFVPAESKFRTPHTALPKTQIISNGNYSLMVTNAGGGYSRWRGIDLTRWRADTTRDAWGTFCYIRDLETDRVWSNSYQPVGGKMDNYVVGFTLDHAEIRRSDGGIETGSRIIVAPEDDVEIRHVTIVNRSGRPRVLEITSYIELSLADHRSDRMHPAFQKMFVFTERVEKLNALVAGRRRRNPDDEPVWAGHLITFDQPSKEPWQMETDRLRFIGRGRSPGNPDALRNPLSGSTGMVLDPMFSLRRRIRLRAGQTVSFSIILGAAETRDSLLALLDKYSDPKAVHRALERTWRQSQLELRHLRIQPEEARRFQHLASYMLFPGQKMRSPEERLRQNVLGQAGLWAYGISGDLPILAVTLADSRDINLVTQLLQAHTYWRRHGFMADFLIINEESSGYDQPLHGQLTRLINGHTMYTGTEQPGGVFLRNADQIPEESLTLLLSAANVAMVAARGPLPQQLGAPPARRHLPVKHLPKRLPKEEASTALRHMELKLTNGMGGFSTDGREYVITLRSGEQTPAPWVNIMANPSFGCLVSESGAGFSWYGNSQRNRLTAWSNDPVSDPPSDAVYIRDEDSGIFWTPTPNPIREVEDYRVRHGAGYTVFEHNSHGIEQELTIFVPLGEDGSGDPVRIQRLRLKNDTPEARNLSVTFYLEWVLGEDRESSQMFVNTAWDSIAQMMMVTNRYNPDYPDRVAFASISPHPDSCTADRTEFLGRNGNLSSPEAMRRVSLSGKTGAGLDPCSAIQTMLTIPPGEKAEVICLLGQGASRDEARDLTRKYRHSVTVQESLNATMGWWDRLLGKVEIKTPVESVNLMVNRWLLYQVVSCRIWARSGFYQSGGAFGFRDQLQDVLALLYAYPRIARSHILTAAGRQFAEGDVQHWWHPPGGAGIRSRCSDDLLWLPYAVIRYVHHTGDAGILDEMVPFIWGEALDEDVHEAFMSPTETARKTTLYDHCMKAIERGATSGPHGLPLIGSGDWNDGMNRVGLGGKGESVWLAWFLVDVLRGFSELSRDRGRDEDSEAFRERAAGIAEAVEKSSWDGRWYRRAYFDDGTPLGSAQNDEDRIDSIPQSWAVISGGADGERSRQAVESAWDELVLKDEGLALLLTPPFDGSQKDPGYIKGYPPGVRENGGQYSHGAVWLAKALAGLGDGDRAVDLLTMLNPIEHAGDPEKMQRYRTEPYVMAADVYRLPGHVGQGGWTWYTGAAGWMYRVWIEDVLGIRVKGDRLMVDPVIPGSWDMFSVRYRRGKAIYEITVQNPDGVGKGVSWIEMDGRRLDENAVPLVEEEEAGIVEAAIKHKILVRMGEGRIKTDAGIT
ncbi:N,N'-diacetylchitobiose phosphorylase [bacterium BMS3Abin14]|nr:N,N'-diacetylchitobiose phosphorylase [bacterium BMS3Abin14]